MPPTIEQLVSCMNWAAKTGLKEIVLDLGSSRVTILRDPAGAAVAPATPLATPTPPMPENPDDILAPLAGLCHLAPEPGGARFVTPGDRVAAGQTLCIIEAMKVMIPVTAAMPGTVEAVLISDGDTVGANAALMRIAP